MVGRQALIWVKSKGEILLGLEFCVEHFFEKSSVVIVHILVRHPSRRSQIKAESFLRFSTGNEILNDHSEVDPDNDRDGQSLWGCPDMDDMVLVCC